MAYILSDAELYEDDMLSKLTALRRRQPETLVHKAADAHRNKMQVAVSFGFAMGRNAIDRKLLREAIATKDLYKADVAVAGVPFAVQMALEAVLSKTLLPIVVDGGKAGLELLKKQFGQLRAAAPVIEGQPHHKIGIFGLAFNRTSAAVKKWAADHAAELAKNLSDTTREDVATALMRAFDEGDLDQLEDDVIEAVGDVERGKIIAGHETMIAASQGQRESWDQAREAGYLTGSEEVVWIATADQNVCPICEELDGKTRTMDGEYPDPGGAGPPNHVGCRCTEGISG